MNSFRLGPPSVNTRKRRRDGRANQQGPFGRSGLDVFGTPETEDGVLGFEVGDLAQQDVCVMWSRKTRSGCWRTLDIGKAEEDGQSRRFQIQKNPASKNGNYRGGTVAEQRFCRGLKTTGREGAAADGNRGRKTLWLLT